MDYRVENCESTKLNSNEYDLIYGAGILHHLDLKKSLNELNRLIGKNGTIIFIEPLGTNPIINLYRKLITYLVLGHCFIIAISNYLVQFPINIFGLDYTIGTFTFPIIVLATDLTVRLSNATNARKVI